jgi:hypothetical protein
MPEPILMKLGTAPEPISTVYFINPSHQSVCLYAYTPIVAREWLGKNITAATNIHTTVEEMLDASLCVHSVSYHRGVCWSACVSPCRYKAMSP